MYVRFPRKNDGIKKRNLHICVLMISYLLALFMRIVCPIDTNRTYK